MEDISAVEQTALGDSGSAASEEAGGPELVRPKTTE
jgi:hypothetical protein